VLFRLLLRYSFWSFDDDVVVDVSSPPSMVLQNLSSKEGIVIGLGAALVVSLVLFSQVRLLVVEKVPSSS
jgi:hypothetical protein